MNLHRLHCFTVVVENGSISQGAKVLNMTQPPLSMMIRKLEEELNVILFERHKNKLILTDTGELLYNRAKELLTSSDNIFKEINEYSQGMKGQVRIGCSTSASITMVPNIVTSLQEKGLDITINVREGNYTDILRELRNNEIDLALVRNVHHSDDIHVIKLIDEPLMLALPPCHHLLGKKRIQIKDLKNEKFLMQRTTYGQNISEVIFEVCYLNGFKPEIIYWGTTSLPILFMINKGAGITFLPQSFTQLHDSIKIPPLVRIDSTLLYTNLSLITLKNRYKTTATKQAIEIIKEMVVEE